MFPFYTVIKKYKKNLYPETLYFYLKIHRNAFGGRVSHGSAGELTALSRPPSWTEGEGRQEGDDKWEKGGRGWVGGGKGKKEGENPRCVYTFPAASTPPLRLHQSWSCSVTQQKQKQNV